MSAAEIAQVRRFYRLVTQRAGALDDRFLGRERPLGASRLLYEIGPAGSDLRELRQRLGLDSGYVSRLVNALGREGLVRLRPNPADRRVRRAELTTAGRRELREMNRRSDRVAGALLEPLSAAQRTRLLAAMTEVHRLLQLARLEFERVDPASATARWCVGQYFDEINRRFATGYDPAASLSVGDDAFRPPSGACLVALVDGQAVGCGSVTTMSPTVGWLKRMWVADATRGLGIGRRLLAALEAEARVLGLTTLRLDTNSALQEAIALYRSVGFREVPPFNDEPYADHWFEKRLG